MKRIAFLCVLALATAAATVEADERIDPPDLQRHVFGALALTYDPAIWTVEDEDTISVRGEHDWSSVVVTLEVRKADALPCSVAEMEKRARRWFGDEARGWGSTTLRKDGLDIHVGMIELGCRNWAGAPVAACAVAEAKVHLLTAIGGCELHHANGERVLDLLQGLGRR